MPMLVTELSRHVAVKHVSELERWKGDCGRVAGSEHDHGFGFQVF